jgi:hypothetical protein
MARFRLDNTEGYSQEELELLNAEFERRSDGETDVNALELLSERVLSDYDSGLLK